MKALIPKTIDQANVLLQHFDNLTAEQLAEVTQLYRQNGYGLYYRKISAGVSGYRITLNDEETVTYRSDNEELSWYKNGASHREDGPARISSHGNLAWSYEGFDLIALFQTWFTKFEAAFSRQLFNSKETLKAFNIEPTKDIGFIKSLIEFLWQNGYQFDEYLPGSFNINPEHEKRCEEVLSMLEKDISKEETLLSALKQVYIALHVKAIKDNLWHGIADDEYDAFMEVLKNIDFINAPTVDLEKMFNEWQMHQQIEENVLKLNKLIHEILVQEFSFISESEETIPDFLYHVTYFNRLDKISDNGLQAGQLRSLGGAALNVHAGKGIFLTDEAGIDFWYHRAQDWANHNSDNVLEDELIPVVLRVDIGNLEEDLDEDEVGTLDSRADAWIYKKPIPSNFIEAWNGSEWVSIDEYYDIDISQALDIESIENDDGEEEEYYLFKYDNPLKP